MNGIDGFIGERDDVRVIVVQKTYTNRSYQEMCAIAIDILQTEI